MSKAIKPLCQGIAKSTGKQCLKNASEGTNYCYHHQPKVKNASEGTNYCYHQPKLEEKV